MVALATDGSDGPTDTAGGIMALRSRARQLGLDPSRALANNDAHHYLTGLGDLLQTGPTYTNVNDLLLLSYFPAPGRSARR